jgi:hypothetical protein
MSFRRKLKRKTEDLPVPEAPVLSPELPEDDDEIPRGFAFVMPCMNRRDHAERSVAELMKDPRIDGKHNHFVFVDFYCPDHTGDILAHTYKDRVHVLSIAEQNPLPPGKSAFFHKPLAHNSGAFEALMLFNPQYLVFLDADTLVTKHLLDFVFHHASPDRFLIFEPNNEAKRDLTGFLVVHKRAFTRVNGFDTRFMGWGAEDLELRIKLLLRGLAPYNNPREILRNPSLAMQWTEIPLVLANAIPHSDERRTGNYEEKDKDKSHSKNLNLLCSNIYEWLGVHPLDLQYTPLSSRIQRLLGMDLLLNPKSYD